MSDQVVFTKEEVEKIRNAVYVMQKTFEVLKLDAIKQIPEKVLFLLDSPRPRPRIELSVIERLSESKWFTGRLPKRWINDARLIISYCGFDVED